MLKLQNAIKTNHKLWKMVSSRTVFYLQNKMEQNVVFCIRLSPDPGKTKRIFCDFEEMFLVGFASQFAIGNHWEFGRKTKDTFFFIKHIYCKRFFNTFVAIL